MQEPYNHIYNRGAHKLPVFIDEMDYFRMVRLLYIANSVKPFVIRELPEDIFTVDRGETLVHVVAYCLMPNHIHIALKKKPSENPYNISIFMRKLMTGYSNYFNTKYRHSGTIWQGAYKEKTAYDTDYINTLINYIHLNDY